MSFLLLYSIAALPCDPRPQQNCTSPTGFRLVFLSQMLRLLRQSLVLTVRWPAVPTLLEVVQNAQRDTGRPIATKTAGTKGANFNPIQSPLVSFLQLLPLLMELLFKFVWTRARNFWQLAGGFSVNAYQKRRVANICRWQTHFLEFVCGMRFWIWKEKCIEDIEKLSFVVVWCLWSLWHDHDWVADLIAQWVEIQTRLHLSKG